MTRNWLAAVAVAALVLAPSCDSSKDDGPTGGGTGGISGTGGAGTGGAGSGGAGPGVPGGPTLAEACAGFMGAVAVPADFSLNTDTNMWDAHRLRMDRGSIVRRVTNYVTDGPADHQHEFNVADADLAALQAGQMVTLTTSGPPLDAAAGHTHTVTVHPCP